MFFVLASAKAQNFKSLSIKKLNGDTVSMAALAGKKVLVIVLPLSQSDSNFSQIQAFRNRYLDTVQVVGVLSFEDGFQAASSSAIQSLYSNMGIILTEGMYSRKTSGAIQAPFMRWLTDRTKNRHFDNDVQGIGQKFFVSESGRLFAVIAAATSLSFPFIDRIVHTPAQ